MKSTVEALEGNKVKVSVEVDETEVEKAVDDAFRRIAREVRIPGFRPGKAPRRVLEARLGSDYARAEALREALPEHYIEAIKVHEVDVIDSPSFDITDGEEAGPVSFDAVVEIRPTITVEGYDSLSVTIPRPTPSDDEIQERIDAFRAQMGELADVDRPAAEGDNVSIDIEGTLDGEPLPGLTAEDYLYELGSGNILPEVDEQLEGASAGDELQFTAEHPDPDEEGVLDFRISVKAVKERVLPDLTDEWAQENTEFDSVEEYRADVTDRLTMVHRSQANMRMREALGEAIAELVTDDVPDAMVRSEMDNQLQNLAMRLSSQGISVEQYLAVTGRDVDDLREEMRAAAEPAVKVDLALRAIADAEGLEVDDAELADELDKLAERVGSDPAEVRAQLERNGQVPAVRSDIRKQKAFDWLAERVELVDDDGDPIDRALLVIDEPEADEPEADADDQPADEAGADSDTKDDDE